MVLCKSDEEDRQCRRRVTARSRFCARLRQAESGTKVSEVCREYGISDATFYIWKKKYAGLGLSELRELRQLREGCLQRLKTDPVYRRKTEPPWGW